MNPRHLAAMALASAVALLPAPAAAFRYVAVGETAPVLQLADEAGRKVQVPAAGRATVVVFVRPGQRLSDEALAELGTLDPAAARDVDLLAIAAAAPATTPRGGVRVLVDVDGRAGERYGVIVYPSIAVIGADGRLVEYLPSHAPQHRGRVLARLARGGATGDPRDDGRGEQARAAYLRGMALAADGRHDEAAAAIAQALTADATLGEARLALANIRLEQDRPRDALREFDAVLAQNPASPAARVGSGLARLRLGHTEEGIRLLEESLALNPEPVRAHYELARAYEVRGDLPHAVEHYRAAYLKLRQGRK